MSEGKILTSLGEFIESILDGHHFIIPDYQRGYVWGKSNNQNKLDAVSYICNSIIDAFKSEQTLFLQGITYCEVDGNIELVDGQQRMTFFFILLKYLGYNGIFRLRYNTRKDSEEYLKKISTDIYEYDPKKDPKESRNKDKAQDIFFFNRTMRIIRECFDTEEFRDKKERLRDFVLNRIQFLRVKIQPEEASLVFTMMNSQKADMLQQELIKSELLRTSSLRLSSQLISELENQQIRSRLAREWDKWLRWWNRDDVKNLFCTHEQMGWLLKLYLYPEIVQFEDFRKYKLIQDSVKEAKRIFEDLRLLQKRMEDAFYNAQSYNYIGFILRRLSNAQCLEFMYWYFIECAERPISERHECLEFYFDCALIEMKHKDVVATIQNNKINNDLYERFNQDNVWTFLHSFADPHAYSAKNSAKNNVKAWLMRRNIIEDNHQGENDKGRKFDFSIWDNWSLEHIIPQSWFYYNNSEIGELTDSGSNSIKDQEQIDKKIDRAKIGIPIINGFDRSEPLSEHCIGNLVLLYKPNNSSLGALSFEEKKDKFFDRNSEIFKSRHLLHTVKAFGRSKWETCDIKKQYEAEINTFIEEFGNGESKDI